MDKIKSISQVLKQAQRLFHGIRFDVYGIERLSKKGNNFHKEFVAHPGAVVIIPFLDKENIVMIRNQRFAVNELLWELPAGTLESEEAPLQSAARELIEETGYEAQRIEPLIDFFTSPGICNEIMYAYAAYELNFVGQALEETEDIQVSIVKWSEAIEMIKKGVIVDAKTITTLLYMHLLK